MKILVSDYSSNYTTEPLYINTVLNQIGCKSTLLSENMSVYDGFDLSKPDVHITHFKTITRDLIEYLKNNQSSIDLIINITEIDQQTLHKLDKILHDNKLKPCFYFTNEYDHNLVSRNNITTILLGADLFIPSSHKHYDIDYAIIVEDSVDISEYGETYHFLSCNNNMEHKVDIFLPVSKLKQLYPNYKHVLFKYFDGVFTQMFFDAGYAGIPIFYDVGVDEKDLLTKQLSKLLGKENCCSLDDINSGYIRDIVMAKHTCFHRVKSILSQLPAKEYVDNLQKIIQGLPE